MRVNSRSSLLLIPLGNRSQDTHSFCRDSRGQAHFSAATSSTEHANSHRKMSQTPTC